VKKEKGKGKKDFYQIGTPEIKPEKFN